MKNKGFTIVEMLSAFTLSSIIIIILFQLIINLKEIYSSSGIKTELLNKQYLMTNKIYNDLNEKIVQNISPCEENNKCVTFTYSDGTIKKLEIDEINKTLAYDNYIIKLNSATNFGNIIIDTSELTSQGRLLNIKVPIYNDLIKNTDFGINIVYRYDDELTVNTTNYNYKINGITVPSSENTPTMENPITYTGLGETGNIQIKQNDTTLATINMAGHDPLMCSTYSENICDYIDYENSVIVRYVKKYTFTGSEEFKHTSGWAANDTETTKGVFWINSTILGSYPDDIIFRNLRGFCSHFPLGDTAYTANNTLRYGPSGSTNQPYLSFRIPIDTDMDAWVAEQYNAGTQLIAYYILIEPEYEIISLPSINTFTDISSLTITDGTVTSTIE